MPDTQEYLQGFKIYEGLKISKYKLVKIEISHNQVVKWNEYAYPTKLVFSSRKDRSEENVNDLKNKLENYVSEDRIIRTASTRPYLSKFSTKKVEVNTNDSNRNVTFKFMGHAKRVSEAVAKTYL